ncbi:unnamed protein product [Prorocentrum cordatum]|uniref:Protein kinase domain-containing protein n=1 Tax=Prorocentrum cordatum TaxID=2364126 RepID=A0ABN9S4P8_9DINO|nr:unnamed protein product [Polarella glacialis]
MVTPGPGRIQGLTCLSAAHVLVNAADLPRASGGGRARRRAALRDAGLDPLRFRLGFCEQDELPQLLAFARFWHAEGDEAAMREACGLRGPLFRRGAADEEEGRWQLREPCALLPPERERAALDWAGAAVERQRGRLAGGAPEEDERLLAQTAGAGTLGPAGRDAVRVRLDEKRVLSDALARLRPTARPPGPPAAAERGARGGGPAPARRAGKGRARPAALCEAVRVRNWRGVYARFGHKANLRRAFQESRAICAASSDEGGDAELGQRRKLALPVGAAALVLALVAAAAVYSTSEDGSGLGQRQRVGSLKTVGADAQAIALQELDGADEWNTSGDGTGGMVGTDDQPDSKCGNSVCYRGATCCPNTSGGLCGSPGSVCCGSSICSPGSTCCGKNVCAAPGSTCCGDTGVCSPGSTCCPSGINGSSMCCSDGFQCCPPESGLSGCCPIAASLNNVTSCGAMKCAGGSICCKDRLCGTLATLKDPSAGSSMWPRRASQEGAAGTLKVTKVAERVGNDEAFAQLAAAARMCDAPSRGDLEDVKAMLELGLDIDAADTGGRTALHYAGFGPADVVDSDGIAPLEFATIRGSPEETISLLMKAGADMRQISRSRLAEHLSSDGCLISKEEVEIGEVLSETLKSCVYRAVWRGTDVVAKSVLESAHGEDSDRLTQDIHNPDLMMFLGAVVSDTPIMLITENMEGGDLESYYMGMRKEHQTPNWHAAIGQQIKRCSAVARGLCFLHSCKTPIIHRDLKPLNLLLSKLLEITINDFGISKMIAPVGCKVKRAHTMGVGSHHYMAPEVVRSGQYDLKADIYSFALIMYFISSGRDPFWERNKNPTLILEEYGKNKQPRPQVADAHPFLGPVMRDAWAEEPGDRPDARELIQRLAAVPRDQGCGCGTM